MGKWETKFKEFFEKESNKNYAYPIFSSFIFGQIKHGEIREILNDPESYKQNFFQIFEDFAKKKEYSASIFPTLIAPKEASNFFLEGEKKPEREEIFRFLYLISTGIYHSNMVINLITKEEDKWEDFLSQLKSEASLIILNDNRQVKGINLNILKEKLGINIPLIPLVRNIFLFMRNIFLFTLINFFVVWWLEEKNKIQIDSLEEIGKELIKIGISNDAVLVLFEKPRGEKTKVFFYPRLNRFIQKWYLDYLTTMNDENNYLPKFLFSLLDFSDERSIDYLDKFLYFLLRGNANGEILDKLLNLKIKRNIDLRKSKKQIYPILKTSKFFEIINK